MTAASTHSEDPTYVFCLVESDRQPPAPEILPALPSAGPVLILRLDSDIWLVAAHVSPRDYAKEAIERCLHDLDCVSARARAHESTVAFFFKRGPVIPLKLFTLFATDDRAVKSLRRRLTQIRRLFNVVRDHEEWGVRFTIDPDELPAAPPARMAASGRDYLEAKKQRRQRANRATGAVRKEAAAALSTLGKIATRTRRQKSVLPKGPARPTMLEAAFLIPSEQSKAWKARARALGVGLARRGCRLEITGPWPPYNFVATRSS